MRLSRTLLVTSIAAAIAGVTAVAAADRQPVHTLLVHLPDGSVEQVRYTGDVAPHVVLHPVAADPMLAAFGADDSPFAMMDRISAQMDAQMSGLMRQAAMMQQMTPEQLRQTALAGAPAGATSSFTMISTSGGNGACSQSIRTVSLGDGRAPQVTRTASGDCGSAMQGRSQGLTPTVAPAAKAPPVATPAVLPVKPVAPKVDRDSI
ncbi:hypothetical protein [Sphingomonas abietis]|uniref:DUF4412 domain-containing protein n=1 Tax=Sphingomonas abietis TaxID=3012344 RepID=A0ABY7NMF2_9SPHN|nr:hypothetical protein [Sphingomonas abietis]WBO22688.1 hypothetical protein PBT88_00595 [Sphingomonas abietis]